MNNKMPDTEILVHITAPSRASDDADYRALATAYFAFKPSARIHIGTISGRATEQEDQGAPSIRTEPVIRSPFGAFISPELSFGSVAHNLSSPELRRHPGQSAREAEESQSSWRAPPSVIEDSIPNNDISIARYCSPTRILEHYLQGLDSSQSSSSQPILSTAGPPSSPPRATDRTPLPTDRTPLPAAPVERAFAVSRFPNYGIGASLQIIPQTPSPAFLKRKAPVEFTGPTSETRVLSSFAPEQELPPSLPTFEARGSEREKVRPSTEAHMVTATPWPSSQATVIPSSRAGSEPPLPPAQKRQRRVLAESNSTGLSRSTSDIGPRQEKVKKTQLDRRQRARQTASGLEVHSPEPPIGLQDLTAANVVTTKLEKLARDVGIKKRFQPKEQSRDMRPFERGYWHVDCAGWPDNIKLDTWAFLTNYVSNGDAGWGIWCRRSEDYSWIRLYCWGCVVGHMHLLLYLASRRQLNYTGTTWNGGDGEVVIVMEPKYERTA